MGALEGATERGRHDPQLCVPFLRQWRGTRGAGDSAKLIEAHEGIDRARPRPAAALSPSKFGEWLSLVEHLVRDQGVGGSNPLSPTIKSRNIS